MSLSLRFVFCLMFSLGGLGLCGCNKPPTPPAPLAIEQIPTEMQTAFAKAAPEVKAKVDEALRALQSKDYPAAYQGVNSLFSFSSLSPAQRTLASRVMLTLSGLMQSAQAQGDQSSGAMLDYIRKSK